MSWRVFEILDWWGLAFFSPAEHCITLITITTLITIINLITIIYVFRRVQTHLK